MIMSDSIAKLSPALVAAMPKVKTALKDSTNPFFKSKYADLGAVWDAIRDALSSNSLAIIQMPDCVGEAPALTTTLIHGPSGEWISATYPLMVTDKECTPQGYGSALTYARRYGLSAVMGVIADEDDDGNAASKRAPAKQEPTGIEADLIRASGKRAAEEGMDAFKKWGESLTTEQKVRYERYIRFELLPIAKQKAADKVGAQ